MRRIRVIAPMGATIRGAAVLALTPEQYERRKAVLTQLPKKKGLYALAEGAATQFKLGEELGIDGIDRLNMGLFEDLDAKAAASPAAATSVPSEPSAPSEPSGASEPSLPLDPAP